MSNCLFSCCLTSASNDPIGVEMWLALQHCPSLRYVERVSAAIETNSMLQRISSIPRSSLQFYDTNEIDRDDCEPGNSWSLPVSFCRCGGAVPICPDWLRTFGRWTGRKQGMIRSFTLVQPKFDSETSLLSRIELLHRLMTIFLFMMLKIKRTLGKEFHYIDCAIFQ